MRLLMVLGLLFAQTRFGAYVQTRTDLERWVLASSARHGVPEALVASVGVHESRWGHARTRGRVWGVYPSVVRAMCARVEARCTSDPEQAQVEAATLVLHAGHHACGSWDGAVRRYLTGLCWRQAPRRTAREARRVYRRRVQQYTAAQRYARSVGALQVRIEEGLRGEGQEAEHESGSRVAVHR